MGYGGDYKTSRNHLTQPKPGKQFLNNVINIGRKEMKKPKELLK